MNRIYWLYDLFAIVGAGLFLWGLWVTFNYAIVLMVIGLLLVLLSVWLTSCSDADDTE